MGTGDGVVVGEATASSGGVTGVGGCTAGGLSLGRFYWLVGGLGFYRTLVISWRAAAMMSMDKDAGTATWDGQLLWDLVDYRSKGFVIAILVVIAVPMLPPGPDDTGTLQEIDGGMTVSQIL